MPSQPDISGVWGECLVARPDVGQPYDRRPGPSEGGYVDRVHALVSRRCAQRGYVPGVRTATMVLVAAVLVGACGSDDGGDTSQSFASTQQMADAVGCTDFEEVDEAGQDLFSLEEGRCQIEGETVQLLRFAGGTEQDQWISVAEGFASESRMVVGADWVVLVDDPATADDIRSNL